MIESASPDVIVSALEQRLRTAATALLADAPTLEEGAPELRASLLLHEVAAACPTRPGPEIWLFLTAVLGRFPTAYEVEAAARVHELDGPDALVVEALGRGLEQPLYTRADLEMDLITDRMVIQADYCARNDNHTGIQRVARAVAQRWHAEHDVVAVADTDERSCYRNLTPTESVRVYSYGTRETWNGTNAGHVPRLLVPWRTTVLFPEVPHWHTGPTTHGLCVYSGNATAAIGYDMIPILSAGVRPIHEAAFTVYLSALKHMDRIAAISGSAGDEFSGFASMLSAQGLSGPEVRPVTLPEDLGEHPAPPSTRGSAERPLVVVPARLEVHKNVLATIQCAHRLWQEGLDFELVMLGGAGWGQEEILEAVGTIQEEGHPLTSLGWVPDAEMWQWLADASFVAFVSLHEGYGLPIVEALSCGTPVLTSNFGSQAELAALGGCVTADPRDPASITAAMRELITNPARLDELRAEIPRRPARTWDDYSAELWQFLAPLTGAGPA